MFKDQLRYTDISLSRRKLQEAMIFENKWNSV